MHLGLQELKILARFPPPSWPRPGEVASSDLGQPARTWNESRNTVSSIWTLLEVVPELMLCVSPLPTCLDATCEFHRTAESTGSIAEDRVKVYVRRYELPGAGKMLSSLCVENA